MISTSKTVGICLGFLLTAGITPSLDAQGTFQNLNFESATIVPVTIGQQTYAQFGPAFPSWIGYYGSSLATVVLYNNRNLGSSSINIFDGNYVDPIDPSFFHPISNFTAVLQSGNANFDVDVALAQTGTVPAGTASLRFLAQNPGRTLFVSMGGQLLSLAVLQDFGGYQEFGADISMFAGQTAELRFTQRHGGIGFAGDVMFDNISFSTDPVPEPSTWALFALGSALCWCAARRRRK